MDLLQLLLILISVSLQRGGGATADQGPHNCPRLLHGISGKALAAGPNQITNPSSLIGGAFSGLIARHICPTAHILCCCGRQCLQTMRAEKSFAPLLRNQYHRWLYQIRHLPVLIEFFVKEAIFPVIEKWRPLPSSSHNLFSTFRQTPPDSSVLELPSSLPSCTPIPPIRTWV